MSLHRAYRSIDGHDGYRVFFYFTIFFLSDSPGFVVLLCTRLITGLY